MRYEALGMGNPVQLIGRAIAGRAMVTAIILVTGNMATVGCQVTPSVSIKRLAYHREISDLSGLATASLFDELKVTWATPSEWESLPVRKSALYTHRQWRSPSESTGVGVAHVRLPLALPAETLVWFARKEYLKRAQDHKDGRLIGTWTDALGRQWFEAENSKYHVRGYAMTRGSQAWIVYSGWRVTRDPHPDEIALAQRSLESIVPAE
jgi:hypothetical protein